MLPWPRHLHHRYPSAIYTEVSTPECMPTEPGRCPGEEHADVSAAWAGCFSRVVPPVVGRQPGRLHHTPPCQQSMKVLAMVVPQAVCFAGVVLPMVGPDGPGACMPSVPVSSHIYERTDSKTERMCIQALRDAASPGHVKCGTSTWGSLLTRSSAGMHMPSQLGCRTRLDLHPSTSQGRLILHGLQRA